MYPAIELLSSSLASHSCTAVILLSNTDISKMLSSEPNDEECDATTVHSSNAAGPIKSLTNIFNQIRQYETIAIVLLGSKNTDCKPELAIFARPNGYYKMNPFFIYDHPGGPNP